MVRLLGLLVVILCPLGCTQPVRQDRSIRVSEDGKNAAFQGDQNAVFIKDLQTGTMKKIYDAPGINMTVSAPRWDPAGQRLIFCTAKTGSRTVITQNAKGEFTIDERVQYTCWLYDTRDGDVATPRQLFSADCKQAGYIGADLVARWSPDGMAVDYVDRTTNDLHSLFRYDLQHESSQRIFSEEADGIIFNRSPDGQRLYCLLGTDHGDSPSDGLWVQDRGQWWQVPETRVDAPPNRLSVLEHLRRAEVAWSHNGQNLTFISHVSGVNNQDRGKYCLNVIDINARNVEVRAESPRRFRDIHWHPDNERVGVVAGQDEGKLFLLGKGDRAEVPIVPGNVREFAGWTTGGDQMAYVVAEPLPGSGGEKCALLFIPNSEARSAICIANADGKNQRRVFSGLRATFLRWTPKDEKLSVWLTFEPTYRSWPSISSELMRPVDPAAIIDPRTRAMDWMPVRGFEQAELGHYHLMRREFDLANKWYSTALEDMSEEEKRQLIPFQLVLALGKNRERNHDAEKLANALLAKPQKPGPMSNQSQPLISQLFLPQLMQSLHLNEFKPPSPNLLAYLQRDMHLAEVFLGLGDLEGGTAWFSSQTGDDDAILSSRLMLSQFLLLREQWSEYANCICRDILPRMKMTVREVVFAAIPLGHPELLEKLPNEQVVSIKKTLAELSNNAKDRWLFDMVLREIGRYLKDDKLVAEIDIRLPKRPAVDGSNENDLGQLILQIQAARKILDGDWSQKLMDGWEP